MGAKKTKRGLRATPLIATAVLLSISSEKSVFGEEMNSVTGVFGWQRRHPGRAGRSKKDEVSRFVSRRVSRPCSLPSDLTHSQNQPASNIPYPKEMCPLNSCFIQLSEICFMFLKKTHTFSASFTDWKVGRGWSPLWLVHSLALVHLTAWGDTRCSVSEGLPCNISTGRRVQDQPPVS